MDGGAWWPAVYGRTESDTTEATQQQQQQQQQQQSLYLGLPRENSNGPQRAKKEND